MKNYSDRKRLERIRAIVAVTAAGIMAFGFVNSGSADEDHFSGWPAGASPKEVGKRIAENFAARKLDFETNRRRDYITYSEACAWYGSLTFAEVTGDDRLRTRLIQKFNLLETADTARISQNAHVDHRVFGIIPLEIYILTKDKKYLEAGKSLADKQWESATEDGITSEARYQVDDMYMVTILQVQAYRATDDVIYLNHAAAAMTAYIDKLQQPNGLFYHGVNAPVYWGRGNGWIAAGMAELLSALPKNHPKRARIMDAYKKMIEALLEYQGNDGLWRQLLDHPKAWPETSGTAMFTFAIITGVKNGWLNAEIYGPAARRAWLEIAKRIDKNANLSDICVGTSKWTPNQGDPAKYYLKRPRRAGDLHGQAPILWAASALLR